VVADDGRGWVGPAAFLTCLWALAAWREWALVLGGGAIAPLADLFFAFVSANRATLGWLLPGSGHRCTDGSCGAHLAPYR
jgi:hypothetical protein